MSNGTNCEFMLEHMPCFMAQGLSGIPLLRNTDARSTPAAAAISPHEV